MGLSLGASGGGTSGTDTKSGASSNTYSPWQTLLQGNLGSTFQNLLQSLNTGSETSGVQSLETQSADKINKTSAAGGDRVNKFLASRGFGASGATGSAGLEQELSRQSDLAGNQSNFAGLQLNQNQGFLTDALMAAFNSMGKTENSTENQSTSQWGVSGGASVGFPGAG